MGCSMHNIEDGYQKFVEKVESCLQRTLGGVTLCNFNLIFFPIVSQGHIFCFCFDLVKKCFNVIDNLTCAPKDRRKYSVITDRLLYFFSRYMDDKNFPVGKYFMEEGEPKRLPISWKTRINEMDCGIFTMRHMETYFGLNGFAWKAGFRMEADRQREQLRFLRFKYTYIMLTNEVNMFNNVVADRVGRYRCLPSTTREKMFNDAMDTIVERLKAWE